MVFWIIALGLAALCAALLATALFRRGAVEGSAASDVQVYRDQLREVDRDLARGVLTDGEAEQARIEVSRRLLEADRAARSGTGAGTQAGDAPRPALWAGVLVVAAVAIGGAAWVYTGIGAPGYPDLPLDRRIALAEEARLNRPSQADAEEQAAGQIGVAPADADARYLELVERLREAVAERPDDLQGNVLLARNEAVLGNFVEAHRAQARVIEIKGAEARAEDFASLADFLVLAAGGYVSPEAERAVEAALARDPANGTARYYAGLLAAQTGRADIAFRVWRPLLEGSPPEAPWVPPIRAQIEALAQVAGVDYVLTATDAPRGPSADQIEAAGDMSPAERIEMIEGMVSGLAERLATEGGPPQDWARLIRAYGVLGRREAAAAIWAEAQDVFPDDITRVPILQAARDAGVAQ